MVSNVELLILSQSSVQLLNKTWLTGNWPGSTRHETGRKNSLSQHPYFRMQIFAKVGYWFQWLCSQIRIFNNTAMNTESPLHIYTRNHVLNAKSRKSFYFINLLLAGVLNAWKFYKCWDRLYIYIHGIAFWMQSHRSLFILKIFCNLTIDPELLTIVHTL